MSEPTFLTLDEVFSIHADQIRRYGGLSRAAALALEEEVDLAWHVDTVDFASRRGAVIRRNSEQTPKQPA